MTKIQILKIANSLDLFRDCFFYLKFICHLFIVIWNLCEKGQQLKKIRY